MSRELDEHRRYLADRPRLEAFSRAIAAVVRPGDVVVDLGCGTGILGLLACRAGAARVYSIDAGDMAEVARALAAASDYADRVTIVNGHSRHIALPERANVVVSDQTGHFGWEAGVLEYSRDARRRFLMPGGRLVPRAIRLWIAPVEVPILWQQASFWRTRPAGFDMLPAQEIVWNSGHAWRVEGADLLAAGCAVATLNPADDNRHFTVDATLRIARAGRLHGVAGWFSAELADGVWMTNAPGDPCRIDRRNSVFLLPQPLEVSAGQILHVHLSVRPEDLIVSWVLECWQDEAAMRSGDANRRLDRVSGSTFRGMLVSPDALHRTAPSFVPRLTERGRARKRVLDLADGRTSVAGIERALHEHHPDLFPDVADAGVFVAEVISRYAE
jgi:hypothetical protein